MYACGTWAFRQGDPWVFYTRIYASFGENHGKLRTTTSRNSTGNWTWRLSSTSFNSKIARPLVGPNSHRNESYLELYISPLLSLRQNYVWGLIQVTNISVPKNLIQHSGEYLNSSNCSNEKQSMFNLTMSLVDLITNFTNLQQMTEYFCKGSFSVTYTPYLLIYIYTSYLCT